VLQTPTPQNPLTPEGDHCVELDGDVVAPFGDLSSGVDSCTVKRGTRIFVVAATWECSTFDGDHPKFGTSEAELRRCARHYDVQRAPTVTLDGHQVVVTEVSTGLLGIYLPHDNLFGLKGKEERQGQSVAHGWVTLLDPLSPGTHTIEIHIQGSPTITTTIIVT
jgi:hypothetical protein